MFHRVWTSIIMPIRDLFLCQALRLFLLLTLFFSIFFDQRVTSLADPISPKN